MSVAPRPASERFWEKVEKTDGCWLWKGRPKDTGYGQFTIRKGKVVNAHRFAFELVKGPVPDGLQLDHLCRNRICVNPDHLEAVTMAENIHRGESWAIHGSKSHCPAGHPYDAANTYVGKAGRSGSPSRHCRTCRTQRDAVRHQRRKAS